MFENRRWLVIPTSLTSSIDFNEVHQTSVDTLRLSIDGTKTFVKYDIYEITESYQEEYPDPETDEIITESFDAGIYGRPSIYNSSFPEYNHTEILNVLTGSEWTTVDTIE